MRKYLRLFFVSLCLIVIVAAISIVYAFAVHGFFTLHYIFRANFLAGFILIAAGIVIMFLPAFSFLENRRSLDRFNYVENTFDKREKKQQIARLTLWLGLFITVLAGLIQILLAIIL